jgi:hypothetical protein
MRPKPITTLDSIKLQHTELVRIICFGMTKRRREHFLQLIVCTTIRWSGPKHHDSMDSKRMSKVRVGREIMGHTIFMRTSEEGEETARSRGQTGGILL